MKKDQEQAVVEVQFRNKWQRAVDVNEWFASAKTTISGTPISSPETNSQFPFRYLMLGISEGCWSKLLMDRRRTKEDVAVACEFLKSEYREMVALYNAAEEERREKEKDYPNPLWDWVHQTDIRMLVESADDDWLASVPNGEGNCWRWSEIDLLLALVAIDYAVDCLGQLEECHPMSAACHSSYAATWAMRASDLRGLAMAQDWYEEASEAKSFSDMGKAGADAKHKETREAKIELGKMYSSKLWPSMSEAARQFRKTKHGAWIVEESTPRLWIYAYEKAVGIYKSKEWASLEEAASVIAPMLKNTPASVVLPWLESYIESTRRK